MKSSIFIPSKICVGYCNREDTYTKKLAYVVYYDNRNTSIENKEILLKIGYYGEYNPKDYKRYEEFKSRILSELIEERKLNDR